MMKNIFGKQNGKFDETMALRAQRSLYDQMRGAFAAMTNDQRIEACGMFTKEFSHDHREVKFSLVVTEV